MEVRLICQGELLGFSISLFKSVLLERALSGLLVIPVFLMFCSTIDRVCCSLFRSSCGEAELERDRKELFVTAAAAAASEALTDKDSLETFF